jgi:hypothetical protein
VGARFAYSLGETEASQRSPRSKRLTVGMFADCAPQWVYFVLQATPKWVGPLALRQASRETHRTRHRAPIRLQLGAPSIQGSEVWSWLECDWGRGRERS